MNIFLVILFSILFFFLFSSVWGFYIAIKPPRFISNLTPKDLGLEYEAVSFTTTDDILIKGWFIPHQSKLGAEQVLRQNKDIKTIILLHGYPADKGNILPGFIHLVKTYNLFLFDFRYLGESGGRYSTAGAKETEDLLAALRFLRSRRVHEVGVWGFSMGGAVALMTAPQAPEIKAIVSESSYARLDLMGRELYRVPFLREPLGSLTRLWAWLFFGFDPKDVSPVKGAKNLQIPVLIIHSKTDELIPFSHALLLQEALKDNPKAEFWFGEELVHGQFGETYQKRIQEFFEKNL